MVTEGAALATWEGRPVEEWREAWGAPRLVVLDAVGSTNDVARALAEAGAPTGTAVVAERQTAGRGRGGRRWHAPHGAAILLSVVLRPPPGGSAMTAPGAIPLRIGLAVARAAERVTGAGLGLKWPNDVVAPGRGKVAGILCEAVLGAGGGFVVAGIGVNVSQRLEDFPDEVRGTATSLSTVAGRQISRPDVCGAILDALRDAAMRYAEPLDARELEAIADRDVLRGRELSVDGVPRGVAVGIAPEGALRLRGPDGSVSLVHSGTVRVLGSYHSGPREHYP